MQRFTSKICGRDFYIHPTQTTPIDGLPCFSKAEIEAMKGKEHSKEELDRIFDAKLEPITETLPPHEDMGYAPRFKESPAEIARRNAQAVRDMLIAGGARTAEEKKLPPPK